MTAKLPVKARVLEYFALNDRPISSNELSDVLTKEYGKSKLTDPDYLEKMILCYCRVGMIKSVGLVEENHEEILTYQVTASGKKKLVYIPGHGNKVF
ncbi:hypothetical protein [Pseudoramibacter faecis]|uniref:hypothetical protein n=1 Tax=Pseudoramibacter faecis TaxID=3108534 RepID=UPI002E768A80|nr:hypothetical protein [Pseudoramibacter sp. HA2172]